MRHGI
jgi:hypothetical protein